MYTLDERTLELVRAKVHKLNAHRTSRQVDPITLRVGTEHRVEQEDGSFYLMYECELEGSGPIYDDWAFMAVVEHTPHGNIVSRVPQSHLPQIDLTQYRTGPAHCDVCNTVRNRLKTYVVVHTQTGEIKIVGSNCLKDFFPDNIVSGAILRQMHMLDDLDQFMRVGISTHRDLFDIDAILQHTAAMIRVHGWVSRAKATETGGIPTITRVFTNISASPRPSDPRDIPQEPVGDDDRALATATRAWMHTLTIKPIHERTDYEHNLVMIDAQDYTDARSAALVASAVSAYRRTLARELAHERKREASQHVGNVGDRTIFIDLTVERIFDNDTLYGVSFQHIFHDATGNIYTWRTSSYRLEEGCTYTLLGTIKAHTEYKGVAQTELTRCKYTRTKERV
jgi:hypothetical protein